MSAAHTPGPWFVWQETVMAGPPIEMTAGSVKGYRAVIAEVHGDEDMSTAQCKANARLIAAAPDLLTALQEAELELDRFNGPADSLARIRAAIAKAQS